MICQTSEADDYFEHTTMTSRKSRIPVSVKKPSSALPSIFFSAQRPSNASNSHQPNLFKQPNQLHIDQSRIPSTVKSTSRINRFSNGNGFNSSVKKNAANLFGVTPQMPRNSYMQSGPPSTSRLSRSSLSSRGHCKDNRQLSDQSYQRELQDKIVEFLNTNGYPGPVQRQMLVRLSMADACRIFQFLFSFIIEDVVIKNGPDTSLDVVAAKMLPLLGYPYPIKRSDLVSFSGGRQLGSVLSMMEYLIDFISYSENMNVSNIAKRNFDSFPEDDDDGMAEMGKIEQQLIDITCSLDWQNMDEEEQNKRLTPILEEIYGTEAEFEQLSKELYDLQQTLKKLDDELNYHMEIPKMKDEVTEELAKCRQYIEQMREHNEANEKLREALMDEIRIETEKLEQLKSEHMALESRAEAQKDVRVKYKYAMGRSSQLKEENKQLQDQIETLEESIRVVRMEINKKKSECAALADDVCDAINVHFESYRNSKIHRFFPGSASAALDDEWQRVLAQIQEIKSLPDNMVDDDGGQKQEEFKTLIKKKILQLKVNLSVLITDFETKASMQVACENQKAQKECEKLMQELTNRESQLKTLWEEKNTKNDAHRAQFEQLEQEVETLKDRILELEKMLTKNEKGSRLKIQDQIDEMEQQIKRQKFEFVEKFRQQVKKDQDREERYLEKLTQQCAKVRKMNQFLEQFAERVKTFDFIRNHNKQESSI